MLTCLQMVRLMKKNHCILFLFCLLLPAVTSCERGGSPRANIAVVNDTPISLSEFQKEVPILTKRNPAFKATPQTLEEQLNTIIDKKLLLQEARSLGLAEDERFIETIKSFWEQTLIKELLELKAREWADRLFVTEEEINRQYQRMQRIPFIRLVRTSDRKQAEDIKGKMLKGVRIKGEEAFGPLFVEDVRSDAMLHAFDMAAGKAAIYEDNGGYVVLHVIKTKMSGIPPLKQIYNRIKTSLLEQKKQSVMEEWLKEIKRDARIQIDSRILKEAANEQ